METTVLPGNRNDTSSVLSGEGDVINSQVIISSQEEDRQNFPVIQQVAGYVQSFLQQFRPTTTTITKVKRIIFNFSNQLVNRQLLSNPNLITSFFIIRRYR